MKSNTVNTHRTGQARGHLVRLERELAQFKRSFDTATHRRLVGGIILSIGTLILIWFLVNGNPFIAVIAVVTLISGGLVFIKALMNRRGSRNSINTVTDNVTDARNRLEDLENQPD